MPSPVTLKIKFKSETLDEFIDRYAVDVSKGGIFIRTQKPLAVGTNLKFEFQLQNGDPMMSGDGTVVWIREADAAKADVVPGMGLRFDRLPTQSQNILDQILEQKNQVMEFSDQPTRVADEQMTAKLRDETQPAKDLMNDEELNELDRTPIPQPPSERAIPEGMDPSIHEMLEAGLADDSPILDDISSEEIENTPQEMPLSTAKGHILVESKKVTEKPTHDKGHSSKKKGKKGKGGASSKSLSHSMNDESTEDDDSDVRKDRLEKILFPGGSPNEQEAVPFDGAKPIAELPPLDRQVVTTTVDLPKPHRSWTGFWIGLLLLIGTAIIVYATMSPKTDETPSNPPTTPEKK